MQPWFLEMLSKCTWNDTWALKSYLIDLGRSIFRYGTGRMTTRGDALLMLSSVFGCGFGLVWCGLVWCIYHIHITSDEIGFVCAEAGRTEANISASL